MVKDIQTPADRNSIRQDMRETVGTLDDSAAIIVETQAFPEGTNLFGLGDMTAYQVAASGATDHHRTTAGGDKLYALKSGPYWNAKTFGATGDGVTDDSAALQLAIETAAAVGGTLWIPPGDYVVTSSLEIPLSTDNIALHIIGYGVNLEVSGAIVGLGRERPTTVVSGQTDPKITIEGIRVVGNSTTGQIGFAFYTTYDLQLRNCNATGCDIGFLSIFGLGAVFDNCETVNCKSYGFFAGCASSQIDYGSGAENAIAAGGVINSASNGTHYRSCRVFSAATATAHFRVDAAEVMFTSCIAEGAAGDYCFYYENLGSSTSKGCTWQDTHIECAPGTAVWRIATSTSNIGGAFTIEGTNCVINDGAWTGAIFDFGSITPVCVIFLTNNKVATSLGNVAIGSNTGRHPQFVVDTIPIDHWQTVGKWGSGTVGNITTTSAVYDTSNMAHWIVSGSALTIETGLTTWALLQGIEFVPAVNKDMTVTASGTGGLLVDGRFKMRDAETGFTTPGSVVGRAAVYDDAGTLIGYAPLYDGITA